MPKNGPCGADSLPHVAGGVRFIRILLGIADLCIALVEQAPGYEITGNRHFDTLSCRHQSGVA